MNEHMKALYLSTQGDDTIDLPVPLEVENYLCGIVEMSGKVNTFKGDLFLCCDICEESYMGENMIPVLRSIKRKTNGIVINDINHVIWLRVMRLHISNIRLYMSDESGEIKTVDKNKLNCTLLFVPSK